MKVPRSAMAKNRNTHIRKGVTNDIKKSTDVFNTICKKHKVGNLTFKDCKFADEQGNITYIEFDEISGNMRASTMIIKSTEMIPSEVKYDLVKIAEEKVEKDRKKREEDLLKVQDEVERETRSKSSLEKITETDTSEQLMDKLLDTDNDGVLNDLENNLEDELEPNKLEEFDVLDDKSDTLVENTVNLPDTQAVNEPKKSEKPLGPKYVLGRGNKYHRNFIKDLKLKFKIGPLLNFKYFEVKVESTYMVIENVYAHMIEIPSSGNEKYILAVGDLQIKRGLIKQIDPYYGNDKVLKEQMDFVDKIRAKEESKTKDYTEDELEEEPLDELDELKELSLDDLNEEKILTACNEISNETLGLDTSSESKGRDF